MGGIRSPGGMHPVRLIARPDVASVLRPWYATPGRGHSCPATRHRSPVACIVYKVHDAMPQKAPTRKSAPPAHLKPMRVAYGKKAAVPSKSAAAPRTPAMVKPPAAPVAAAVPAKEASPLVGNLQVLLKSRGMTARGLSLKAGLSGDTVRNILKSRSQRPRAGAILALAGALQVSAEALTGLEPLPSGLPVSPPDLVAVPEIALVVIRQPGEPASIERRATGQWQIPRTLTEARCMDGSNLVITAAPEDCGEVRRGDRVLVDTNDAMPSPPGVFLLWDGFGIGVAKCSIVQRGSPMVRVERQGTEAAEMAVAAFRPEGRILARWQWL
jgi:transcriptional regulator with XRE-family HTH domain